MLTLLWRPRADLDRQSIAIYLGLECNNKQAARAALKRIDTALEHVCSFPDSGGRLRISRLKTKEFRLVLVHPYTIYYQHNDTTLTVYRILHQRQDIDVYTLANW